ncbi:MmoB/DmpM family protein, partial [Pseudomonas fluorescens]
MNANVFIAFQANDETRPIIEAIEQDNPHATI